MTNPLSIIELRATNVKKLRAIEIRPAADGSLVVLGGKNGAGKTSVLDAITMALGGKEHVPDEPIRRGEDRAEVVVDLGDLIVKRTFTKAGGGSLIVQNREGARYPSPQAMLDALVGKLTFDPLLFSREKPARKAEILRELLALDFAKEDEDRRRLFEERTAVNRAVAGLEVKLGLQPKYDAPAELIDSNALMEEMTAATKANTANGTARSQLVLARAAARSATEVAARLREQLERIRRELADAEQKQAKAEEELQARERETAALVDVPTEPIAKRLAEVSETNRKVALNQTRAATEKELEKQRQAAQLLTSALDDVDAKKAAAIAAAKMPIPGLGFSPDGVVTLNGFPLEQASGAEKLRVSVAIGLAMNPRLRVLLIRDASLLDSDSLRLVAEMAREARAQVWLERVTDGDGAGCSVVIEDGEVRPPEEPA